LLGEVLGEFWVGKEEFGEVGEGFGDGDGVACFGFGGFDLDGAEIGGVESGEDIDALEGGGGDDLVDGGDD